MTDLPRDMRYGLTRVARIRNRVNSVRQAIRAGDVEASQKAWDRLEQFLPYFMQVPSTDTVDLHNNPMVSKKKGEPV